VVTALFDLSSSISLTVRMMGGGSGAVTCTTVARPVRGATPTASEFTSTGRSGEGYSGTGSGVVDLTSSTTVTANISVNRHTDPLCFSSATYTAQPISSNVPITVLRSEPLAGWSAFTMRRAMAPRWLE
jgi:hypothetical protein